MQTRRTFGGGACVGGLCGAGLETSLHKLQPHFRGPKKDSQSQNKLHETVPKNFLQISCAFPNKTRALRQITPESSLESSAKSLSHNVFCLCGTLGSAPGTFSALWATQIPKTSQKSPQSVMTHEDLCPSYYTSSAFGQLSALFAKCCFCACPSA